MNSFSNSCTVQKLHFSSSENPLRRSSFVVLIFSNYLLLPRLIKSNADKGIILVAISRNWLWRQSISQKYFYFFLEVAVTSTPLRSYHDGRSVLRVWFNSFFMYSWRFVLFFHYISSTLLGISVPVVCNALQKHEEVPRILVYCFWNIVCLYSTMDKHTYWSSHHIYEHNSVHCLLWQWQCL